MKWIKKDQEPEGFIRWKEQEKETIERLSNNVDALWEHLPNTLIQNDRQEEGVFYYSKQEIKQILLSEQNSFCAYCNRKIHDNEVNTHSTPDEKDKKCLIEHIYPKSHDWTKTFDFNNLVGSCQGGQKNPPPKELYCDAKKSNSVTELTPLMQDCEKEIIYATNGLAVDKTDRAKFLIKTVKLNFFRAYREKLIEKFFYNKTSDSVELKSEEEVVDSYFELTTSDDIDFQPLLISIGKRLFPHIFGR